MVKVPIVFTVDINMIGQAFVSIGSILEHRQEDYMIEFFIMVPDKMTQKKGDEYVLGLMSCFHAFNVAWILIDNVLFDNVRDTMNCITKTAMYRILIPDYLTQYDKCLYCDSDILVYGDIIELFREDLGTNYIAGSLALFDTTRVKRRLGMKMESDYINSGILLMNLVELRKDKMVNTFLETIKSDISDTFIMQDQDLINICCSNKIKVLSPRYNIQLSGLAKLKSMILMLYPNNSEPIWTEIQKPIILHFTGEWLKPWKCPYLKCAYEWWKTAEQILPSEELKQIWESAEKNISEMFFSTLLTKVREARDIVIFGFSETSNHLLDSLLKNRINTVRVYCDNNTEKQGVFYKNIVCLSVEDASKMWKNAIYIISVQTGRKDIKKQLTKYGIMESNIVQYIKKPEGLAELVEEKFKERLLKDNALEESKSFIKN